MQCHKEITLVSIFFTSQDQQDKSFLYLDSRTAAGKQRGSQQKTSDNPRHHPSEQFYKRGKKNVTVNTWIPMANISLKLRQVMTFRSVLVIFVKILRFTKHSWFHVTSVTGQQWLNLIILCSKNENLSNKLLLYNGIRQHP